MVARVVVPSPAESIVKSNAFDKSERHAIYRVIGARRDVRRGFLSTPMPEDLLNRILAAAHNAPSVGLMQPWRFIVVRSPAIRSEIHAAFQDANQQAMHIYEEDRREQYASLKLEGILEAPQNLCIVCDPQSQQGHGLGRQTMPETAIYSSVCAVQNLWLAARAEGVGVGWVSILSPNDLRRILNIPENIIPIAYLCLGFVDSFGDGPELERLGWERRRPLEDVVFRDRFCEAVKP